MDKLSYIKDVINNGYALDIFSVERFNVISSKFTNQDHHFILRTPNRIFFLKRYNVSHLNKIINEINAFFRLEKQINIPHIFQTKNGQNFLIEQDDIFVLYQYIDCLNLRDINERIYNFFDILCDIESELVQLGDGCNDFYDFEAHILRFESEAYKLLNIIKNASRPHSSRDVEYLEFIIKEVHENKSKVLNLKIKKNLIHGDFLMQNILKDKNKKVWVLDWEKSLEYVTSIDVMRCITFTMFNSSGRGMGLNVSLFVEWASYCFKKIPLSQEEILNALEIYYFHLITNIDFLSRLYIEGQNLNEKMAGEDFFICKWFKDYRKEIQTTLDKSFH